MLVRKHPCDDGELLAFFGVVIKVVGMEMLKRDLLRILSMDLIFHLYP